MFEKDSQISLVLKETLSRSQGIILINGTRVSGIEMTFQSIINQIQDAHIHKKGCMVVRDTTRSMKTSGKSFWHGISYDDLILNAPSEEYKEADVCIFENVTKIQEFESAIETAEDGRLVIIHTATPGLMNSLHRFYGYYPSSQNQHLIWRFIDLLILLYSEIECIGEQKEKLKAGEIILLNPEHKKILIDQNLNDFEHKIKTSSEDSGVMTLNQSLLQLIIRRKISLKTAFEVTRDPLDLDLLLKKVGI